MSVNPIARDSRSALAFVLACKTQPPSQCFSFFNRVGAAYSNGKPLGTRVYKTQKNNASPAGCGDGGGGGGTEISYDNTDIDT